MEAVKELSEDLKEAVGGSSTSARLFSVRAVLAETEERYEREVEKRRELERDIREKEDMMEKERRELDLKIFKLNGSAAVVEGQTRELLEERESLNTRLEDRESRIKELESQLRGVENSLSTATRDQNNRIEGSERRRQLLQNQLAAAQERAANAEQLMKQMEDSRKQEIEVLESHLKAEKERRLGLERRSSGEVEGRRISSGGDERVFELTRRNAELVDSNRRLEKEIDLVRDQIRAMEKHLTSGRESTAEVADLRAKIDAMEKIQSVEDNTKEHLDALRREKEAISSIVEELSPTGDREEGIRILQSISAHKDSTFKRPVHANKGGEVDSILLKSSKLKSEVDSLKAKTTALESALVRVGRRVKVLERERAALRSIVDAYEEDMLSNEPAERRSERIKALEGSLKETEATVKTLAEDVARGEDRVRELTVELAEAQARRFSENQESSVIEMLRSKVLEAVKERDQLSEKLTKLSNVQSLEKETDGLKRKVAKLESELLAREKVEKESEGSKILHLKDNPSILSKPEEPTSERKRPRLEQDNTDGSSDAGAQLKKRIADLEAEATRLSKEEVAKAVTEAEKRALRTREVARMKIEEFRLACYNLFGYKMQVSGAKYTLSSMYADREEDVLCFGRNESGGMELLETPYCARLQEELDQFLRKWNSIPALLAHITSDNFQKTTVFTQL
ncbi:hypothetical protein NDN08_004959 [Rhodosorus marinus]|uniref:Mitotic spindle assembly checkpoint protein MAD1 n=1 Tax=Rhodosorus marinus TaxID=101924 RepID=A0AAV8UF38_9RHOD|nr:hypothetical protein NDN08_004959 [Rhodosorus marinus]